MLCLAGLLILGAWFFTPGLIDEVDQVFRQHYLYEPKARFEELIGQYQEDGDNQVLVEGLAEIIEGLPRVQKVDEIASVIRSSYAELVRVFISVGDLERAMYWNTRLLEFDPMYLPGLLAQGRLLMAREESRGDGVLLLASLQARFPNSLTVADGRALAWASTGELGRAFMEFLPFLPDQDSGLKWQFGHLLATERFERTAGEELTEFTRLFRSGESIEVQADVSPPDVPLVFSNTSLELVENKEAVGTQAGFLFRKEIQHDGMLQLVSYPLDRDFTVTLHIRVAEPGSFQQLMQPAFRELIREQLQALGATGALARFERAHESR